jgi:hypothetical protein
VLNSNLDVLNHVVKSANPEDQSILSRFANGESFDEVASRTGHDERTVRCRSRAAVSAIRQALAADSGFQRSFVSRDKPGLALFT